MNDSQQQTADIHKTKKDKKNRKKDQQKTDDKPALQQEESKSNSSDIKKKKEHKKQTSIQSQHSNLFIPPQLVKQLELKISLQTQSSITGLIFPSEDRPFLFFDQYLNLVHEPVSQAAKHLQYSRDYVIAAMRIQFCLAIAQQIATARSNHNSTSEPPLKALKHQKLQLHQVLIDFVHQYGDIDDPFYGVHLVQHGRSFITNLLVRAFNMIPSEEQKFFDMSNIPNPLQYVEQEESRNYFVRNNYQDYDKFYHTNDNLSIHTSKLDRILDKTVNSIGLIRQYRAVQTIDYNDQQIEFSTQITPYFLQYFDRRQIIRNITDVPHFTDEILALQQAYKDRHKLKQFSIEITSGNRLRQNKERLQISFIDDAFLKLLVDASITYNQIYTVIAPILGMRKRMCIVVPTTQGSLSQLATQDQNVTRSQYYLSKEFITMSQIFQTTEECVNVASHRGYSETDFASKRKNLDNY